MPGFFGYCPSSNSSLRTDGPPGPFQLGNEVLNFQHVPLNGQVPHPIHDWFIPILLQSPKKRCWVKEGRSNESNVSGMFYSQPSAPSAKGPSGSECRSPSNRDTSAYGPLRCAGSHSSHNHRSDSAPGRTPQKKGWDPQQESVTAVEVPIQDLNKYSCS